MQKSQETKIRISITVFSAAAVFLSLALPIVKVFTDGAPLLLMTCFVEKVVETASNPYTQAFFQAVTTIFQGERPLAIFRKLKQAGRQIALEARDVYNEIRNEFYREIERNETAYRAEKK